MFPGIELENTFHMSVDLVSCFVCVMNIGCENVWRCGVMLEYDAEDWTNINPEIDEIKY